MRNHKRKRIAAFAMVTILLASNASAQSYDTIGSADAQKTMLIAHLANGADQGDTFDKDDFDDFDDSEAFDEDDFEEPDDEESEAFDEDDPEAQEDAVNSRWPSVATYAFDSSARITDRRNDEEKERIAQIEAERTAKLHTAVDNPNVSIEATLGYDGLVRFSQFVPLNVKIKNTGDDLNGSVAVNLYRENAYYDRVEQPVFVASGGEKEAFMLLELTYKQSTYTIEYTQGDQVIASVNIAPLETIDPSYSLIATMSDRGNAMKYLDTTAQNDVLMRGDLYRTIPLTADTFPTSLGQMSSFKMLFIDSFDLRTLNDEQRNVLDNWLRAGGVLFVGGGALASVNHPYLSRFMTLDSNALTDQVDITPALSDYLRIKQSPLDQNVMICNLTGDVHPVIAIGDQTLIARHVVGKGVIYLSAFEIGTRPMDGWLAGCAFWQSLLIKDSPAIYQRITNGWDDYRFYEDNDIERMISGAYVDNPQGARIPFIVALMCAYLFGAGIIAYLILKKMDKRGLLWVLMPLSAIAMVGAIFLISKTSGLNTPVSSSLATIGLDEENNIQVNHLVSVTSPNAGRMTVSTADHLPLTTLPNESEYFGGGYYGSPRVIVPDTLRTVTVLGDASELNLPGGNAWTTRGIKIDSTIAGQVDTRIWREEDGLHATITNNLPYTLSDCALLTSIGFSLINDIAPGETALCSLLFPTDQEQELIKEAMSNDLDQFLLPGRMNLTVPGFNRGYGNIGLYTLIENVYRPYKSLPTKQAQDAAFAALSREEVRKQNMLSNMIRTLSSDWNTDGTEPLFRFVGFSKEMLKPDMVLGDIAVDRTSHFAMVNKAIPFEPVGATGIIYYPPGMIQARNANLEPNGTPKLSDGFNREYHFEVRTQPVFGFTVAMDKAQLSIDTLAVDSTYYDANISMCLYDFAANTWVEQKTTAVELKGVDTSVYFDENNTFFVLYKPNERTETYANVGIPIVSVSGRLAK